MTPWGGGKIQTNQTLLAPTRKSIQTHLALRLFSTRRAAVYAAVQAAMADRSLQGRVIHVLWAESCVESTRMGGEHPRKYLPMDGALDGKLEEKLSSFDTVGISDRTWLDRMGHPHSDALHW